ncbi:hypothetical protein KFK09_009740 [Dendrobium nobile]|uniref:Uncharacterized protein n=1 Tax=Dendrobium nobile TaxID=94219 RepID=A0A8T3BID3_DENNO|nr:hypothetical protein KFK09_009740 [Dendrobium nobile]
MSSSASASSPRLHACRGILFFLSSALRLRPAQRPVRLRARRASERVFVFIRPFGQESREPETRRGDRDANVARVPSAESQR